MLSEIHSAHTYEQNILPILLLHLRKNLHTISPILSPVTFIFIYYKFTHYFYLTYLIQMLDIPMGPSVYSLVFLTSVHQFIKPTLLLFLFSLLSPYLSFILCFFFSSYFRLLQAASYIFFSAYKYFFLIIS